MNKNIFITGGTGFIGSHFINEAHSAGYNIFALRNLNKEPKIKLIKQPTWIDGNLDSNIFELIMDVKFDAFVHLAAHGVNNIEADINDCIYWNVYASLKILNSFYQKGTNNFVIAGSCFEYGKSAYDFEYIPPDARLLPINPYAISKATAYHLFDNWTRIKNIKLKYLRIFHVFGDGEKMTRFYPALKKAALEGKDFPMTKGEQIRDFITVNSVAKRFVDELDFADVTPGIPFVDNVGTGNPKSLREFAEHWWKEWDAKGKLKFGEVPYRDNEVMRYVPLIKYNK